MRTKIRLDLIVPRFLCVLDDVFGCSILLHDIDAMINGLMDENDNEYG